ncbi:MAG: catalase [Burkholderiales bacterium]|nr:catalase [Burkholderiales bacterium]MBK9345386.1 catalase [Burkholderiales bacterium]
MTKDLQPSTQWQEKVAPDEAHRFAAYAQQFAAIQARKSKKYGVGRALHRKQLAAAQGTLDVLPNLPAFARQGLFAKPARLDVWVRLSNGGMDRASDRVPDVRGFSMRVLGVRGDSALGHGPAVSQDFALINQEVFAFPQSGEFVDFVVAASNGNGALLKFLIQRYGWLAGPARLLKLASTMTRPFRGFAAQAFFSAAPIACGAYAVRVRLLPAPSNGPAGKGADADWGGDFSRRLQQRSLHWELQLQPFVSEALTPIEDASVSWPTPYTTVARLTLPQQDTASKAGLFLAQQIEAAVFDPWQALAAHRPLGDVMRARKVVYYASQKGRSAV